MKLPNTECPKCRQLMHSREYEPNARGNAPTVARYDDCLRRCDACGIAFSNCRNAAAAVMIYRDPLHNVPLQVGDGVLEALGAALNARNRPAKVKKFAFTTSEDAVTWTVFKYLQETGNLSSVAQALGIEVNNTNATPTLLLWGGPVPNTDERGRELARQLIGVVDGIRCDPQSRSEPDVILDFGAAGLAQIEVKHRSGNDRKPEDYAGWADYLSGTDVFADANAVRRTGMYELARNWRIVCDLSVGRPFRLVNLGPAKLFAGHRATLLAGFAAALAQTADRRFIALTWDKLLDAIPDKPQWFVDYVNQRGLQNQIGDQT